MVQSTARELYSNTGKVRLQSLEIKMVDNKPHILVREPYGRNRFWVRIRTSSGSVVEIM